MDKIEKLLRKIPKKDRIKLFELIPSFLNDDKKIKIVKIKNTNFLRVQHGNFRIIFHKENKTIVIDSIKIRNENTYKNL